MCRLGRSTEIVVENDFSKGSSLLNYGVATMSRMLKNTDFFAEYRSLL